MEPKRGSQCEAGGRQHGTIDSSNSWNAVIPSGWGESAATSVVGRSTPRSKKCPTTKGKYAKGQGKSNNNKKGGNDSRKTKRNDAGTIHVVTYRIRRGGNDTIENLDMVRKRHGSSECTKRGQATSAVEGGSKTTTVNSRRTVEK